MKRRDFVKLSVYATSMLFTPTFIYATPLDIDKINFSDSVYNNNNAQTIIVFMYGGASQLAGNLTNIEEIEQASQSSYSYFRGVTKTEHDCWKEAGGESMERLINNGDMTIFRCCYSAVRESNNNKAHGVCTAQNQKGTTDENAGGILTNLATILEANGIVNENSLMPFVTMEGESIFYETGDNSISSYLKPVGVDENFDNPYKRNVRYWMFYTHKEREIKDYNNQEKGFNPALDAKMNTLAQTNNSKGKIKDAFNKRQKLSDFIENIKNTQTPDLGDKAYSNDSFAKKLEAAVKLLVHNKDTKVITLGTGGLGGWDDHNEARDYVPRMQQLFNALESAMAHIKAENKEDNINIMVFGEFGRNVNLNSAFGWDHGNLQNLYVLGGKGYFNHRGIVGETVVDNPNNLNRLWLKPKNDTYWFEPLSIAATIYKMYGIENPEILSDNNNAIDIFD